jgi:hypothetical protein
VNPKHVNECHGWRATAWVYRLITNSSYGPAELKQRRRLMSRILDLGLANQDHPLTEMVAKAFVRVTSIRA